jgi:2-polyprenyl-3-methyl-5-hydroxy-6-metoxy-1,4-benzoquinol methylase
MSSKQIFKTNQRQKEFYEHKSKNLATRVWSFFRNGILNKIRKDLGIENQIYQLHLKWFGNLSDKKVLDLGCYEGNSLSMFLATHAKKYIGIDLSETGINKFNKRLIHIPSATALSVDFLSEDFKEEGFDLVYAYGVLHHFKDVDLLVTKLKEKLNKNGEIISYDPLSTSLPLKIIRALYRPFQSDREWEWPFTKKNYYKFHNSFIVKERRAVLGKSKWFFVLNMLPLPAKEKEIMVRKWHRYDWEKSRKSDTHMFKCMHITMFMQNKD